jgi:hypothetical protein
MKKILLSFLSDWGVNIGVFILLYSLSKIFSPALVCFAIPAISTYWVISSAIKKGRVSFLQKSYPVSNKPMFSLFTAIYACGMSLIPITVAAALLKWQNSSIFWALVLLSFVLFYILLLFLNPWIQKSSARNTR